MQIKSIFWLLLIIFALGCADGTASNNSSPDGCGNQFITENESCDDGNTVDGDGCDSLCQIETGWACNGEPSLCTDSCGDGVLDQGEQCDDGNFSQDDGCDPQCQEVPGWACDGQPSICVNLCGNGAMDEGEECEGTNLGGNTCVSILGGYTGGDLACSPSCTYDTTGCYLPNCPDGIMDAGEECDDGNDSNNDACLNNCQAATCGDGYHQIDIEECDDGNGSNSDDCLISCQAATCGDGFILGGVEECDDGNSSNTDACTGCQLATCGDGQIWAGQEECDDSNSSNTDNCLNSCQSATCGDGYVRTEFEECDDGDSSNTDACLNSCQSATCGDGYVRTGAEECDDNNTTDGDGCSHLCNNETLPVLYSIDTVGGGWSNETITYAGEIHAPQTTIRAAANMESQGKAYIFTATTYHIISLPSQQWIEHGTLSSKFPGITGSGITSAMGVSWDTSSTTDITIFSGSYYYVYTVTNSTGQVNANSSNPQLIDWSSDGTPRPDPTQIKAFWTALENSDGWVTVNPNQLCGASATSVGPYIASINTSNNIHILEAGSCFLWCQMFAFTQFPPFGVGGGPNGNSIVATFYVSPRLYVITQP